MKAYRIFINEEERFITKNVSNLEVKIEEYTKEAYCVSTWIGRLH